MGKIKNLSLTFILMVVLTGFLLEAAYAQSTKPLPPQFTVKLVNTPYNVTNPTGTTQQVDNRSIEFKIENQPFTPSSDVNAIYYLVQVRNPATGYWSPIYSDATYHIQSNTTYTVLDMPISMPNLLPPPLQNASSVDFQLQAQTGYYSKTYIQGQMPDAPIKTNGYWYIRFNPAQKSDWSNTQTVSLSANDPANSLAVPELSWLAILPLLLCVFAAAVILRHKKFR